MSSLTLFFETDQKDDLGGQGRCGTDFFTVEPKFHDFDLIGVKLGQHDRGTWYQINPDVGGEKKVRK